eukprot:Anaeramoba_flamelloidesa94143_119.p5 GENE.a94143_119~~a94143_119.p5  ORF type:complete len:122 (-),score=9.41 a94143_119:572-937(-)
MNNNMYNTNIDATRNLDNMQNATGLNQNPYINHQVNMNPNTMNPIATDLVNTPQQPSSIFTNGDFVKGALIGAAVTYLLTNKGAQENIMKAVSKGNELFQAGMEEMKERYEDARAKMEANK